MKEPVAMIDVVLTGDCMTKLDSVPDSSVDLVYLDPPFFTQKDHKLKTRDRTTEYSFRDIWESQSDYLTFLKDRVAKCREKIGSTGSIFFHCDTSASHHIRCLLDDVFGEDMFRGEIVWFYRRWSNSKRAPLPSHQTIFFYSRTEAYQYHQIFEGYSPTTNVDQILQRRQRDAHGKSVYERDEAGEAVLDGGRRGVPISDVWDIPLLNPKARERVGYPTQKPVLLLERVIELVTSPGDVVLDPFCGSGTTLVAATLLGRRYIGIDNQPEATALALGRLADPVRTSSELLRRGRGAYHQADADSIRLLQEIRTVPVHRNKGIDAVVPTPKGAKPVLVRVQRQNESVLAAAESLSVAGGSKQSAILILVVVDEGCPSRLFHQVPSNVHLVLSTGAAFIQLLRRLEVTVLSRDEANQVEEGVHTIHTVLDSMKESLPYHIPSASFKNLGITKGMKR
ncbi:MAG: DNA methyltransferase [Deltaproteobacteria bacterium]|nr:DNA methyltransferase [Deltaproteobacteria bacterium]